MRPSSIMASDYEIYLEIISGNFEEKIPNFRNQCCACSVNTLRPRWNRRHFADDIFKCIFLNENVWFSIKISLKFIPSGLINNIPTLVQIMAWRRPGDKPLSEPMMVNLPTHICVARPQWVNGLVAFKWYVCRLIPCKHASNVPELAILAGSGLLWHTY